MSPAAVRFMVRGCDSNRSTVVVLYAAWRGVAFDKTAAIRFAMLFLREIDRGGIKIFAIDCWRICCVDRVVKVK